jgi:hypothetical protein
MISPFVFFQEEMMVQSLNAEQVSSFEEASASDQLVEGLNGESTS